MKMFNKYINILILTVLAVLTLNSCVDLVEGQDEGMGYLSLSELSAEVEVYELVPTRSVTSSLSALVGEYNQPVISNVSFTLTGTDYSKTWTGALTEEIALSAGTYTLKAVYNNGDYDGFEEALYGESSQTITISSFNTTTPTVTLPLANSLVAVTMAEGFDSHFTPGEGTPVEISYETAETNAAIKTNAAIGDYVFVPASQAINVKVVGTNSAGVAETTLTYSRLTSPAANTAYNIVCGMTTTKVPAITLTQDLSAGAFEDALYFSAATLNNISGDSVNRLVYELRTGSGDWETVTTTEVTGSDSQKYRCISGLVAGESYSLRARVGNIVSNEVSFSPVTFASCLTDVNASASHTYSSSELTGTAVTASAKVTLPSIIQKLATVKATGTFSNSSNVTRSSSSETAMKVDGTATSLTMTNASGWPYIPKGEGHKFALNATCTIGDKSYSTSSSKESITVPAPEFTISVSAYTSYDKYAADNGITKDISGANSCDPTTLYNAGAAWGISTAIMSNGNYAKKLVVKIDDDSSRTFNVNGEYADNKYYEDVTNLSWASHSLTVSFTFDGTTKSTTQTHYITGLPYSKDFKTDSSDTGWTFVEKNYDNSYSKDYESGVGYLMYYAYTRDKGCNLFSPTFYIPQDIDVAYSATFSAGTTLHNDKSYTIYTGVTSGTTVKQDISATINEKTYCGTAGYNSKQISATSEMTNQANRLCFSHNADLSRNQGSYHYIYFGSFTLNYR